MRATVTGVRGRLFALVLAALLPALGLTLYRALEDRREATLQAKADALLAAESAARTQSQHVEEAHQLLIGLAQLPAVRDARPGECPRLLAGVLREFPVYANLGVAARDGDVVCSAVPPRGPVNVSDRAYFRRAVARGAFAVGEYQIGRITGRASLAVGIPVLERGRVESVVFAALDLDWLNGLPQESRLLSGSVVTVLDSRGRVLLRQPDAQKWVGRTLPESDLARRVQFRQTGVATGHGLDGVRRFYGIAPLPDAVGGADVFVSVGIPSEAALAGATSKLRRDLLVLGLVGLIAFAIALTAGHVFVVHPVELLAGAARRIAAGDSHAPVPVRHAPYELAELSRAFDAMADSLQRREGELRSLNTDLERRVAERTDALAAANRELGHQATVNKTVLDATADAIALTDLDGKLLVANAATRRLMELFGVTPGAPPAEVVELASRGTTDPAGFAAERAAYVADPEREALYDYQHAESGRWFRRYSGPVRDESGAVLARIYTTRDVTAEREADRLKSELLSTVSHELRTPLASILGFSELLLDVHGDDTKRTRYAQTIHSQAQRLTNLVNDFLDLQRIEAGRFELLLELCDLVDVAREQVEAFTAGSARHTFELTAPEERVPVFVEQARIAQVLANLLSNALKYSPDGGLVTVALEVVDGSARVSVTDEGIGIPADQRDRLFTKFFRVDSSDTRDIGGTGLGLALCLEIVEAHGGRIGFESTEGQGSTFWFEIPLAGDEDEGRARSILVVEDDHAAALLLVEHLTAIGYGVDVVASGEQALERAASAPPSLITLDIALAGELDGWQVLARLKSDPRTAFIPVIVCTAGNGRSEAALLGAADFLVKPFSGRTLQDAVARLVPSGKGVVVIADDDEAVRAVVRETLADSGLDVLEAASGSEALALVRTRAPDLLVLDLLMPEMDGFEVLERLHANGRSPGLAIVVLTAHQLSAAERHELSARAVSVMEKFSYSSAKLRQVVEKVLDGRTSPRVPAE